MIEPGIFTNNAVNIDILKKRAYNLRWATVPDGVIPLTAADPDFPVAPEISEAICKFVKDGYFNYGPAEGLPEFKESVSNYFRYKRNLNALPEFIFPVDSAAFGIYICCKAFLSAGDEAVIFDPVDFLFRYSIEKAGGIAIPYSLAADVETFNADEFENLITDKTRIICLCNPLNPTGKVFTKDELLQIGKIACKHNIIILSDEIWSEIIYPPHQYISIASLNEEIQKQTITVTGYSKAYGLAGLRIGTVVASNSEQFRKLIEASQHHSTVHGANIISQIAVIAALNNCEYWLKDFLEHLNKMKTLCINEFNSIPGIKCHTPQACYVAFPDISNFGKSSQEICNYLLKTAKVSVVPGLKYWFGEGAEGHIRISFATSEEILQEALYRIKKSLIIL